MYFNCNNKPNIQNVKTHLFPKKNIMKDVSLVHLGNILVKRIEKGRYCTRMRKTYVGGKQPGLYLMMSMNT